MTFESPIKVLEKTVSLPSTSDLLMVIFASGAGVQLMLTDVGFSALAIRVSLAKTLNPNTGCQVTS